MPSSSKVTIRQARLEDHDGVRRLMDALDAFHAARLPWLFKKPDVQPRSDNYLTGLLSQSDSVVFVADAGRVVGVAFGLMRTAPEFPVFIRQQWGVLDGLAVDPDWRRRGIGGLLAQAVDTWAIQLGARWVEVNVYEVNADARRFYEALGYLPVSSKLRKPGMDGAETRRAGEAPLNGNSSKQHSE